MKANQIGAWLVCLCLAEMCLVFASDRALFAERFTAYDWIIHVREPLFVLFPNSLYLPVIALVSGETELASTIYTAIAFLCVVAPTGYGTGLMLSKIASRQDVCVQQSFTRSCLSPRSG
jgi:hypothetical protein